MAMNQKAAIGFLQKKGKDSSLRGVLGTSSWELAMEQTEDSVDRLIEMAMGGETWSPLLELLPPKPNFSG